MSQIKSFKYRFQFSLELLSLSLSFPCYIQIQIKRGDLNIATNQRYSLDQETRKVQLNESLELEQNIYFSQENNSYMPKRLSINILLHTEKGIKTAGVVYVYLEQNLNIEKIQKKEYLQKCPDKKSYLRFTVDSMFINENLNVSNMSMCDSSVNYSVQQELNHKNINNINENNTLQSSQSSQSSQLISQQQSQQSLQQQSNEQDIQNLKSQISKLKNENKKLKEENLQLNSVKFDSSYKDQFEQLQSQNIELQQNEHFMKEEQQKIERELFKCKQKIGDLLNFATQLNDNDYEIVQNIIMN